MPELSGLDRAYFLASFLGGMGRSYKNIKLKGEINIDR